MKKQLLAVIITLALAGGACSIQNLQMQTIETRALTISEALPLDLAETELSFQMTGGEFNLSPGAQDLVNGTITYNVEQWEPEFTRRENAYKIDQVSPLDISGIPTGDIVNKWDLSLTQAIPLNLTIEGGASDNTFDLSGLQLKNLKIIQGASDTDVRFDLPNPLQMELFTFTTGVSSADIYGLANANFKTMTFSGGAGDYTLDFSGTLTHDALVNIKAGASNIKILVPAGMKVIVNNHSKVSNINTEGTWLLSNNTYITLSEGYTLTINLDLAVGNVTLISGD
jgi:hypothetical protein